MFLRSEDKTVCPQHSKQKRKEKKGGACLPGVRRAVRSQVPGERGKLGEVGEWQCEVRWGARRVVEGEHRAPWAMLVEGNAGISKCHQPGDREGGVGVICRPFFEGTLLSQSSALPSPLVFFTLFEVPQRFG